MILRQGVLQTGRMLALAFVVFSSHLPAQAPALKTIYSFTGSSDGDNPSAPLVIGPGGVLYGVACGGGISNYGTVFSLTPPPGSGDAWTETVLYSFPGGIVGGCPYSLVAGGNGVLYGFFNGGIIGGNYGAVFSLTQSETSHSWMESVIFTFTGGSDGSSPIGSPVIGIDGTIYGAARFGGSSGYGVVFALHPPGSPGGPWTEAILHTFDNTRSGAYPTMGVVIGKKRVLYGATEYGGKGDCGVCGIVYSLTPPQGAGNRWIPRILYSFNGPPTDGELPESLIIGSAGELYGTTTSGGIGRCEDCGTVFLLAPPASPEGVWTESLLWSFADNNIANNYPALAMGPGGVLYGAAFEGGNGANSACVVGSCGMIYSLAPPASAATGYWIQDVLHSFDGPPTDGANPDASVVVSRTGVIYGTTTAGGASNAGTVFELKP